MTQGDEDLARQLHAAIAAHAAALAETPGATRFAVALCLLSHALELLADPDTCPPAVARAIVADLTGPPTGPRRGLDS